MITESHHHGSVPIGLGSLDAALQRPRLAFGPISGGEKCDVVGRQNSSQIDGTLHDVDLVETSSKRRSNRVNNNWGTAKLGHEFVGRAFEPGPGSTRQHDASDSHRSRLRPPVKSRYGQFMDRESEGIDHVTSCEELAHASWVDQR